MNDTLAKITEQARAALGDNLKFRQSESIPSVDLHLDGVMNWGRIANCPLIAADNILKN